MNCMVSSVATLLNCKKSDIYTGIGHGEPIHIAELVAYLLTRGFGLVPSSKPDLSFACLIEGTRISTSEPHMIACPEFPAGQGCTDTRPNIYWFLVPVEINYQYVYKYYQTRDAWLIRKAKTC